MDLTITERFIQQMPAFTAYVRRHPALWAEVVVYLLNLQRVFTVLEQGGAASKEELMWARDVSRKLQGIADGAGFADVGAVFYEAYEGACWELARRGR